MENKFSDIMSKRSDSELLEIVTKFKNDYQADALLAAEIEIQKRNLSTDQIEKARDEFKVKDEKLQLNQEQPLSTGQKVMFLIFFWGVIPWAMAGTQTVIQGNTRMHGSS